MKGLHRHVPVGRKGGMRAAVDRLADAHAFEASDAQRAEIARRAEAFLAAAGAEQDMTADKLDLAAGDWKTRADAAARLSKAGTWNPWTVVGSLGSAAPSPDDRAIAAAIAVAARETLLAHIGERHGHVRGPLRAALAHEKDGAARWDDAMRPLLDEFAGNARRAGADRIEAALRALSAAAHVKGAAMQASDDSTPFLLGSAAASALRDQEEPSDGKPTAMEDLARAITSLNDAREGLWEDADAETMRTMGAAAAFAAFGRGGIAKPEAGALPRSGVRAHLPVADLRSIAGLAAHEAAALLEERASDPRLPEDRRRRLETVAGEIRRHPSASALSCAEALGLDHPEPQTAEFRPGMKAYRAAADGRRARLCAGKQGRPVRCRLVADADGAQVGWLAYDALSREFRGRPLLAAYALDGKRYGYAWAEDRPVIRRGEPEQGFMTAPERIDI